MGISKYAIGTALALTAVVVSSATTGFAIAALPTDSVGQQQLKSGAVTAEKIHDGAITSSKVKPNTFVQSSRVAFGKGFAASNKRKTVLKLPRLNAKVTNDGTPSTTPTVVIHLPLKSTFTWIVQQDGEDSYSIKGGALKLGPASGNALSVHIWRFDNAKAVYLHCEFDTTGFTDARPLSCWAFTT